MGYLGCEDTDWGETKGAITRATMGLIGDGHDKMKYEALYNRIVDQCKRLGVPVPSWAKSVDLCKELGYALAIEEEGIIYVYFNKRDGLLSRCRRHLEHCLDCHDMTTESREYKYDVYSELKTILGDVSEYRPENEVE